MTKKERREYLLKYRYGITVAEYNKIFRSQKKRCAICGKKWEKRKRYFHVDHNHKTLHIRGILCPYCNTKLLRYLRDDKIKAVGLVKYLQKALKKDTIWK